jgi:hypothetical protein
VQAPTKRCIRNILAVLAIAALPGTCAYKHRVADQSERRCGIVNLFKWDYSSELFDDVRFSVDGPDVRVDFTGLKGWNKVCLVEMYEEEINGPVDENPWAGGRYHEIGRWQCGVGNPDDAVTVALIKADGGTLARQLKFPESVRSRIRYTSYQRAPGWEAYPAAGYRQCSDVETAVARCARISSIEIHGCHLFFHPDNRME